MPPHTFLGSFLSHCRNKQLEVIYRVGNLNEVILLSEDTGYELYGQKKYVRRAIVFSICIFFIGLPLIFFIYWNQCNLVLQLLTLNISTILLNAIQQFLLFFTALRNIQWIHENVSTVKELIKVLLGHFGILIVYHAYTIHSTDYIKKLPALALLLIIRNTIWISVSVILPFSSSYDDFSVNNKETRSCAESLEMTLSSKLSFICFSNYIEDNSPEERAIIDLYCLLMLRKMKKKRGDNVKAIEDEIANLSETKKYVSVNEIVFTNKIYDALIAIVMEKLGTYFKKFTESSIYGELAEVLIYKEIVNERLHLANLI